MHIRIATFGLDGITPEEYETRATAVAGQFAGWPGLLSKLWLADRQNNRFGGVYVFDSSTDAEQSKGTELFAGLAANPHFVDLEVHEYDTLTTATAITNGSVLVPSPARRRP